MFGTIHYLCIALFDHHKLPQGEPIQTLVREFYAELFLWNLSYRLAYH